MKTITIVIDQYGASKIEVSGFKGKGCAAATQHIEQVLGGDGASKSVKKKPEFFQPEGTVSKSKLTF